MSGNDFCAFGNRNGKSHSLRQGNHLRVKIFILFCGDQNINLLSMFFGCNKLGGSDICKFFEASITFDMSGTLFAINGSYVICGNLRFTLNLLVYK